MVNIWQVQDHVHATWTFMPSLLARTRRWGPGPRGASSRGPVALPGRLRHTHMGKLPVPPK